MQFEDHPRLRGEHYLRRGDILLYEGSPPPTRGTHRFLCKCILLHGITPAYAGNTLTYPCYTQEYEDHPRLRGEHLLRYEVQHPIAGSPTPTRGTLLFVHSRKLNRRITPAYAGNTILLQRKMHQNWDHPRLRGEHHKSYKFYLPILGSPPPTRGTPYLCVARGCKFRITPAYAGNT